MSELDEWSAAACQALGLDPAEAAAQGVVLDLARDVAHAVVRPAAPVSAYLLGLAVGRGADPAQAAAALTALARQWPEVTGTGSAGTGSAGTVGAGPEESAPRQ